MKRILFLLSFVFLICSCAMEDTSESTTTVQDRVLKSWLKVNHYSDSEVTENGIVILDKKDGTGDVVLDTSYVFLNYYCTTLEGEIKSSNIKSIDEQLGSYKVSNYYGPKVYRLGNTELATGIEQVLVGMKNGAEFTVVLPAKFSMMCDGLDFSALGGTTENLIYNVELVGVVDSITDYEIEQLESYRDRYFNGLDSTSYGIYIARTKTLPDQDTLADATSVNVRYIGRLLDGTVFDTNIADSAKFYRIYDSSKDYDALEMTYKYDIDEMVEDNSTVAGFSYAVHKLKKGEGLITFFWSPYGYADSGSSTIPKYSPLRFDVWVEEDE